MHRSPAEPNPADTAASAARSRSAANATRLAQQALRDLAEATALAARKARLPVLVGVVDDVTVQALVVLETTNDAVLIRLAADVRRSADAHSLPVVIAVGSTVGMISGARRTLTEAAQVAEAALHIDDGSREFHRLAGVVARRAAGLVP
ncbi:hypothetical protein [Saccharopolyspora sp. ASAGF58]|uniref:hypothetical protein n=1 Tax=Saccharopolyspora sp. ASAGF58 TaxID=2719023 RepID=UPI001446F220|nr:hypothetical protein [Saccharopolyspora sp. ASAGF58]